MATRSRKGRRKHRSKFRDRKKRRTIFGVRNDEAVFAALLVCFCAFIGFFSWGSGGCGGGSGPNASVTPTPQEGVVYYLDDHLGNTHLMTDSLGNVVKEVKHYPYGVQVDENEGADDVVADYTYTGKEYDKDTGLVYFGGRYYSPEMGRWISPDPLYVESPQTAVSNPLSSNLYGYVRNNPLSMIDTFGLIENWAPRAYPGVNQTRAAEPYEREAVMSVVRPAANAFTAFMPGFNDARDGYELTTGRDLHTGQGLSILQRSLSGLGLVIGSGAGYRGAGEVANSADTIAEGLRISPYRVTAPGETFIRYESANPAFTKITPSGGVKPGTFAAPASDGFIPVADRVSVYNLPSPQITRPNTVTLTPPPETPIIGPRPVVGGTGNEVIFPRGY